MITSLEHYISIIKFNNTSLQSLTSTTHQVNHYITSTTQHLNHYIISTTRHPKHYITSTTQHFNHYLLQQHITSIVTLYIHMSIYIYISPESVTSTIYNLNHYFTSQQYSNHFNKYFTSRIYHLSQSLQQHIISIYLYVYNDITSTIYRLNGVWQCLVADRGVWWL